MADDNKPQPKPSIFTKIVDMGHAAIDAQIHKARNTLVMNKNLDDDFFYAKAITEEPTYSIHTSGWKEKPTRLQNSHLKQMSLKNTVAAAIIQTRQNQVASHSRLVESEQEKGFMICLRDEQDLIEKMKIQLREEMEAGQAQERDPNQIVDNPDDEIVKAEVSKDQDVEDTAADNSDQSQEELRQQQADKGKDDDEVEKIDWELERKAKDLVRKKFEKARKEVEEYIINCGKLENKPFDQLRWNFDGALRAWARDTYTYDLYATETVPDRAGRPHHWFPVDSGTIKYASVDLRKYRDVSQNFINLDILYPETQQIAMQKQKVLDLKEDLLEKNAYKYVQVIRGKIERAYTADELKIGIRNINTDIYNNGYGLSEMELAVGMITGHLNAEFYNQAYFTQGFSAKGILHIKAAINRRKLETVRQQWQHMVRGSRNSFQTPIFAGVNDVQWIPLTQNHQDIGFEGWMRYLIKMTCAIFQIDPMEIGIGFKEEGAGGGGLSGENTQEKLEQSRDKGLVPLLRHFETYLNDNIIKPFDDRFVIKFTGISSESKQEALDRQEREVKFKKTVNEIREEDGLPPLPGMDNVMLSPDFMTWYTQFSEEAQELNEKNMQQQQDLMDQQNGQDGLTDFGDEDMNNDANIDANVLSPEESDNQDFGKSMNKKKSKKKARPLKIEYYSED